MKVIKSEGGIGNRMFQYALFRTIEEIYHDAYIDDKSFVPYLGHDAITLKSVFPNILYKSFKNKNKFKSETNNSIIYKIIRNFKEEYCRNYIHEKDHLFDCSLINNLPNNCYLRGYWQTEKYFINIRNILLKEFEFKPLVDMKNIDISKKMFEEESVSIHIRKGKDYTSLKTFRNTCPMSYYTDAIKYIEDHVKNPIFYVFTDNMIWVKENFGRLNYTLIDWNHKNDNVTYLDMQLMTHCKHNIIANSSYSWWGAWLNQTPDKIVIGPKIWFNNQIKQGIDIIPNNWIMK
jgi:hypothetical protein